MKTKANGLKASKLVCRDVWFPTNQKAVMFWKIFIDRKCVIYSDRTYTTKRGAKRAAYRFAEKLGISMESVEVVE